MSKQTSLEPIDKWLIFQTNQGTDDHLVHERIPNILPYSSVIVEGVVKDVPFTLKGGHVLFNFEDVDENTNYPDQNANIQSETVIDHNSQTGNLPTITCAAYEPTKEFRDLIKGLFPGDLLEVYGGVRKEPLTINIEKIEIKELIDQQIKEHNPRCPKCSRAMKSIGNQMGFRCRRCHLKLSMDKVELLSVKRNISPGFFEVPVAARRHLAKPIKRMK
jgi:tRNA(Ile2)-agmatinylcytidine synthase